MRILLGSALLVLLVGFLGCGGGGGAGIERGYVDPAQAYLPLKVGNWWLYEYRVPTVNAAQASRIPDRSTRRVLGTHVIGAQQWFEVELVDWVAADGVDNPVSRATVYLRETPDGLYYYDDLKKMALPWINKTAQVGDTWQPPKDIGIRWELVSRTATVVTPAGTFSDCLMVAEHDVFASGEEQTYEVWERWFKRGVGMVMDRFWARLVDSQGYDDLEPWDELALMEYRVN
jgi:hypothetical protein